jgi:tetratricopeptide (TPR) repeat protein
MKQLIIICCSIVCSLIACSKTPDTQTIHQYVRASDAYSQGRFVDTSEILLKQNKFPPALILRAKAEYFAGDIEKAEKSCRRAIKLQPSSLEANLYLARILREKGDYTGAEEITEKLLADDPQNIRVLRLSADIATEKGKFDEAVIFLDRAAEYSAESAMVLLDRARLHWIAGRKDYALDDLSRARAILPWDTPLKRSITNLENLIMEVR